MRVSNFIIGLILIGVISAGFSFEMAHFSQKQGVEYDSADMEVYNQLSALNNLTKKINDGSQITENQGQTDIIGGYYSDAYNAMAISKQSYNTYDTMMNHAIKNSNTGPFGYYLRIALGAIVIIAIVIGGLISGIFGKEM